MLKRTMLGSLILIISLSSLAIAQPNDEAMIAHTIIMQWDKPDARITVSPIVVDGDYAIAGWVQGTHGGRALLQRNPNGWQIKLCGGDNLIKQSTLVQTGIPATTARALIDHTRDAERNLSSTSRSQISSFIGTKSFEYPQQEKNHEHHH